MKLTAMKFLKLAALQGTALAAVVTATPALAQVADDEGVSDPNVIVVTARKRAEDVQTVPIAVSAFTAEDLADRNISNFADLGNSTPGLNITSIAGGTTQQIFVRGLAPANTTTDLNVEANVGTFIDGIYQTSRNTLDIISVLDVGQIEVAKGPQSALFGRSTFAGALSIRTRAPARDFEANFSGTVGTDEDYRLRGSLSIPLGDMLAVRVAGGYLTYDGWGANSAAPDDNLGGTRKWAVNAAIEFRPSENFLARLSGFVTDSRTEMTPMSQPPLTAFNCGTTSTAAVTLGLRQQVCGPLIARQVSDISPLIPETTARTRQLALHLEAKLDGVMIVSETGFTGAENRAHNDYDGTSAGVLLGVCGTVCVPAGPYTRLVRSNFVSIGLERVRTFSQEVRLQSDNTSPFQWIFGANYFDQQIPLAAGGVGADRAGLAANERLMQITQIGVPPTAGVGSYEFTANPFMVADSNVGQLSSSWAKASTQTFSIFGSLGYRIGDLRFSAEGRFNIDRKRAQVFSVSNPTSAPGVNQVIVGTTVPVAGLFPVTGPAFAQTFESFAPRFTLDYQATEDLFLYVSASKGVRAGGFNTANAVSATGILASEVPYSEESNWTYEVGLKSDWFDNRLRINASYFHVDWSNAQVSSFTDNPTAVNPVRIIRNIGSITSDGVELQVEVKPVDQFGFGGSIVYSDVAFGAGAYDGGTITQCVIGTGTTATAAPGCPPVIVVTTPSGAVRAVPSLEGLRPARSVKLQWNLHATADIPLSGDWALSARVDLNHTGPSFANIINTFSFGDRTLTNFRIGIGDDRFNISVWGNNVFDVVYAQNAISQPRAGLPFAFIVPEIYLGEGRRFGITASYKY